jgi:septal ring factor EnvC (AmiA/AmiB activator)
VTNKLRLEFQELRSQLEQERADREQVEAELSELKQNSVTASRNLPEAADLLNQLKAKRKKSAVSLADVETLLEIMEKSCDDTPKGS